MTDIKIDPKTNVPVEKALEPHGDALLAAPLGTRVVALVEFAVTEHTEKGDGQIDDDGEPLASHVVKIRPVRIEIATGDDEHHLRRAFRALWTKRTADGTITGAADTATAEADIRLAAGLIGGAE
jgi:hypothetical protein